MRSYTYLAAIVRHPLIGGLSYFSGAAS